MNKKSRYQFHRTESIISANRGTTLVEMIVCFALLSIFITAAASIIASTTNLYYQVKGQTFSTQVADIVMEKAASMIEGAKNDESLPPQIFTDEGSKITYMEFYDRTDTKIRMCAQDGEFLIYYYPISNSAESDKSREATVWRFDSKVYNNYSIDEMVFAKGNDLAASAASLSAYPIDTSVKYDSNVVVVAMTISSPKYGTYRMVRPVKMYYVPAETDNTEP